LPPSRSEESSPSTRKGETPPMTCKVSEGDFF
jgi:hypothetical protein